MEKVLITGASGLLGGKLVNVLSKLYEVIPTHRTEALHPNSIRMNISDKDEVFKALSQLNPDTVIHTAAETNVDKCETNKEWAWNVNAAGTRNIAEACSKIGAKLVYISTDYVFDGQKGLYSEEDEANPINYYGVTKLKGEDFVKQLCEDFIITRTSVLYGWHHKKLNFATWVIDSLKNRRRISVAEDHYNSPTLADDLAEMIRRLVRSNASGVYHTAGGQRVSRYNLALKIAQIFELDTSLLEPVKMVDLKAWLAKRPRDSSLSVEKIRKEVGIEPLSLDEALRKMRVSEKQVHEIRLLKFKGDTSTCGAYERCNPPRWQGH